MENLYLEAKNILESNRKTIVEKWEKRVLEEVEAAHNYPSFVIRDYLVDILGDLEEAFEKLGTNNKASPRQTIEEALDRKMSFSHGRSRAATPHYTLGHVIYEYALIRQVVMDTLIEEKCFDSNIAEVVAKAVELASRLAATDYSDSIMHVQKKIVGALSHDLRSPLQAALMLLDLLEQGVVKKKDEKLAYGQAISNLERMDQMISDLLDSMDVKAGEGMEFKLNEVNLTSQLESKKQEAKMIYGDRIFFEIPQDPLVGLFDVGAVARILENLVSNAFKHGDKEKPVSVKIADTDKELLICVHNWGSPIPEDKRKEIFDFSNRGSQEKASKEKGWGIGLSTVIAATKAHSGRVELESSKEEGTTFKVFLSKQADQKTKTSLL